MRFAVRHIGSGVWGVWDGGVMGWRADDLGENEAKQQAADMNVMFDQWHRRAESERREVKPPSECGRLVTGWRQGSDGPKPA